MHFLCGRWHHSSFIHDAQQCDFSESYFSFWIPNTPLRTWGKSIIEMSSFRHRKVDFVELNALAQVFFRTVRPIFRRRPRDLEFVNSVLGVTRNNNQQQTNPTIARVSPHSILIRDLHSESVVRGLPIRLHAALGVLYCFQFFLVWFLIFGSFTEWQTCGAFVHDVYFLLWFRIKHL